MINLFRNPNPISYFLLAVIAVLLRICAFNEFPAELTFNFVEPYTRLLVNTNTEHISAVFSVSMATLVVLVQAILFNYVINSFNLLGKPSMLPALMYVTSSALFGPFLILSPPLLCNFLVIWMIWKFISIYRSEEVRSVMYDLSMIVALGTLIYFPFIAMLPLLWISLIIFRPFNWREWTAVFLGFITVYLFLAVFYYWNDSFDKFTEIWAPLTKQFPSSLKISFYDYISLIPVAVILVLSFFSLQQSFFKSFVQVRKSLLLLFYMFLLAMVSFYLTAEFRVNHFILGAAPASVFMGYYFLHARIRWFYESMYLILVGVIVYFQIF